MSAQVSLVIGSAEAMRSLGERLATLLEPGDLVLLVGALGAGKTTLAQGVGAGLGVRGAVTSPTFVIARVHPGATDATPAMVHADLFRLGGRLELDDLDLDTSVASSVTVVEWGEGLAERLTDDRLEIHIERDAGEATTAVDVGGPGAGSVAEVRTVEVVSVGPRWAGVDLAAVLAAPGPGQA